MVRVSVQRSPLSQRGPESLSCLLYSLPHSKEAPHGQGSSPESFIPFTLSKEFPVKLGCSPTSGFGIWKVLWLQSGGI